MYEIKNIWKILHSYEAEIFGYIKHAVGSADIARDLYQDVYLQALQNIQQLDIDRSLKNWLMTVARNRVINYYREKSRREYVTIRDDIKQTDIESHTEYEKHISQALNYLSDSQKEVLRQDINSVDSTPVLREFYNTKVNEVKVALVELNQNVTDKAVQIKINEVTNLITELDKTAKVSSEDIVNILQYFELYEELKAANGTTK